MKQPFRLHADAPAGSVEAALAPIRARGDALMRWFVVGHFALAMGLAPIYSTWLATAAVASSAVLVYAGAVWLLPGSRLSRIVAGITLQMFCALHIFQLHGMPEMHFFFFTSTTMMIVYQDRVALWPGVFLIIGQHILFAWLHNSGVRVLFFPEARVSLFKLAFHFGIALVQTAVASTWAGLLARQTLRNLRAEEERRQLQEKLDVSDRLASLGLLAAGVGHEVNNPLAVILSTLQLIEEEVPDARGSSLVRESLEDASTAAQRIRTIVRDLQMLSRTSAGSEVDLKAVVSGILRACASETRPRARVTCELDDLPRVHGDEGRLGQVFLNLIVNAAHAIPEGRADSNVISITGRATVAKTVQIEVRDSGQGIPAAALPRVFEPFFTTKPIGQGTGLGMAICHRIVTDLGGRIEVESVKGQGTCVRLELPAALPRESSAA